jgi:hypothetical protein
MNYHFRFRQLADSLISPLCIDNIAHSIIAITNHADFPVSAGYKGEEVMETAAKSMSNLKLEE